MNANNKQLISRLIQQAINMANANDSALAVKSLEGILDNECERLSSREQTRIKRILELVARNNPQTPTRKQIQASNSAGNPHIKYEILGDINWPKITIVTPTYNQGQFIEDTILSIVNQNYPNLEYIVMDGGSPDNTMEIVNKYNKWIAIAVSEPDKGQSNAINKGMKLATGDILHWLNSDDMLEPDTLFHVGLCYLKSRFDLLAGTCTPFDNESKRINNRHISTMPFGLRIEDITDIKSTWLKGMYFHQPEVFFSRRIWEAAGGYVDEDLHYSMDYDLWARMSLLLDFVPRVHTSGKSFCLYREHSNQKTSTVDAYLPELLEHSGILRKQHLEGSARSDFSTASSYRQRLSIVAISDFGFNGGAGIAHKRVCQVLQAAGHDVVQLSGFTEWQSETIEQPVESFLEALSILNPDLVLLGNLHNLKRGLEIAEKCSHSFPTIAIAHDFWLLTGRCAYTHGCHFLFTRCSNACPTPQEYPRLDPMEIYLHHHRKKQLLQNKNFYVQANSSYTQAIFNQAVEAWGARTNPIGVVALPVVPEGDTQLEFPRIISKDRSKPKKSKKVRIVLGCTDHADFRKGSDLASLALQSILTNYPEVNIDVYGKSSDLILDSLGEFANRILLHGYLTGKRQYTELLASADIFLGTSREETLGQTFVEAAHAGLITVGPNQSGYADIVSCCTFSLGYDHIDVGHIVSSLENALALIQNNDRSLIKRIQQAQARDGFSGMSFLSSFNHYLYTSGLWKKLRYHSPTKMFDTEYREKPVEEIVLAGSHHNASHNQHLDELKKEVLILPIDDLTLGKGLYPETTDDGTVSWLRSESSLIIPVNDYIFIERIDFLFHWIPEEMLDAQVTVAICGHAHIQANLPSNGVLSICYSSKDSSGMPTSSTSKLLTSLSFSRSTALPDGRNNLAAILKSVEITGYIPVTNAQQ